MIPIWTRAAAMAASAAALTACQTTPTYPVREGYTPARPFETPQPQYPTVRDGASAADPAAGTGNRAVRASPIGQALHVANLASRARTSALSTSLYGVGTPSSAPSTGTMPLIASISERRPAR